MQIKDVIRALAPQHFGGNRGAEVMSWCLHRLPQELSEAQRTLVFQILLKVADLGHLSAPMPIHKARHPAFPLSVCLQDVGHLMACTAGRLTLTTVPESKGCFLAMVLTMSVDITCHCPLLEVMCSHVHAIRSHQVMLLAPHGARSY